MIKNYFANYFLHMSDVTFDMKQNRMEVHQSVAEPWKITWWIREIKQALEEGLKNHDYHRNDDAFL
jgi:glucose-1-phosphate cytidylyltransferase